MELGALLSKLKETAPGAVLQKQPFGRSGGQPVMSVWIETRAILDVAKVLSSGELMGGAGSWALDWLENFSVMQLDEALVASWFLRSTKNTEETLILRGSVVPSALNELVELPSVSGVWPMADPFEREAAELFGIRFTTANHGIRHWSTRLLPEGWRGFPLRKGYIFPTEVFGILHSRPLPSATGASGAGSGGEGSA